MVESWDLCLCRYAHVFKFEPANLSWVCVMVHPQSVTKKYVGSPNTYPIYPIRMAARSPPHHWRLWAPEQSMKPELFCPTPKGKWISHPGTTIEMLRTGWDDFSDFSMSYCSSIADFSCNMCDFDFEWSQLCHIQCNLPRASRLAPTSPRGKEEAEARIFADWFRRKTTESRGFYAEK